MGIPDLDFMFDLLDANLNGYLTSEQLRDFQEELYPSRADPKQIEAAIVSICGHNSEGKCSREHFMSVLGEIERRRTLENKIIWDFRTLDTEGSGRISLKAALFLFKTVHAENFSLKTWQNFVKERDKKDGISFDEIKMFLCNMPVGGPCDDGELLDVERELEREVCNEDYQNYRDLQALQEDEASIALEEKKRMDSGEKIKSGAERLLRRLDKEGMTALLHDGEDYMDSTEKKARQKVTATELIEALRNKYDVLREMLLAEMLKFHIGEGMWTVLSAQEQQERIVQLKLRVRKMRKDGKLEFAPSLPGASQSYAETLLSLMGYSRQGKERQMKEEEKLRKKMEDEDKTEKEIDQHLSRVREEAIHGTTTGDKMLTSLETRYQSDKEILTAKLRGANGHTMTSEEKLSEYVLLLRECLRSKHEHKFESCACAVALAERPQARVDCSEQDRKRQQKLASVRLAYRRGRKLKKEIVEEDFKLIENETGLVDVHENIVKALEKKHMAERELLMYMLQGRDSIHARSAARKLTPDERSNQLLVLKMQQQKWRSGTSEERITNKERHRSILQEAVGIVFENKRSELREDHVAIDESEVMTAILREVQEHQDAESQLLLSLVDKDSQELLRIKKQHLQGYSEEWLDNVSAVLLGTENVTSQEDELVKVLEDKYDALRDKLLMEALMKQFGEAEWVRLSDKERQALLTKLKLQEKRLRQQGKFDEAAKLLGDAFKNADLLQSLLGEHRQKYLEKLKEKLARRQRRIEEGLDPDDEDEETMKMLEEEEAKNTGNILMDLQNRFDDEKEALLRRLREQQDRFQSEKQRQVELARLRREKRQAEMEDRFDSAALVLGLAERNRQNLEERLRRDRERQEQLARERLAARRDRRKQTGEEEEEDPEPEKENHVAWQECVLKEVERKHRMEREFLMALLQEESSAGLREECRAMPEEEQQKAIHELKNKRDELDFGVKADQEMNVDILDMASSYKVVIRQNKLKREEDKQCTDHDAIIAIMADVQEEQGKECEMVFEQIQGKSQPELAVLRKKQIQAWKEGWYENVATVVLRYEGGGTDDELLQALNKKYDALKDKLLLEALKKQMSEAEWAALSEKERQRRLMQLKLEEKRLKKEGKLDELQRLLGEGFAMDASLRKLMGENKARYEEQLKERLARRRERISQGLGKDDDYEDEGEDDGRPTDAGTVLADLEKRYEEEKDALMRKLQGDEERFLSEKQRQAELARLKREQLKAKQEGDFFTAALVLGLAERNREAAELRLKQDRLRHEQLAKERLALLRRKSKKSEKEEEEVKLVTEGDLTTLQDAVIKMMERKHKRERDVFVDLLQDNQPDLVSSACVMTQEEREARLEELKLKRAPTDLGDKSTHNSILVEAVALKFVSRQKRLESVGENNEEVTKDDVIVSLMADLQQEQDKDSETVITQLHGKSMEELIELQKKQFYSYENDEFPNMATVLMREEHVNEANEEQLIQALEDKYDALRDKMIADALMKQHGEAEWKALSEKERMAKLAKMKLEAKKLRREGKLDEIQQMLGEAFATEANLTALMGEKRTSYEQRLKERLEKRRQRQEAGMSKEDIDRMEAEEDAEVEAEIQKETSGNALADLEKRFEDEKEALLAILRGADSKLVSERDRQAALVRLRREERKARKEDTFENAALVIGLAAKNQANLEEVLKQDRERQERLARERLAARRQKRQSDLDRAKESLKDKEKDDQPVEVLDTSNIAHLQEAVVKEMEKRHACEREFFEVLLQEEQYSVRAEELRTMSREQQEDRLFEMKELRKVWRESGSEEMAGTTDEQETLLREATAIKMMQLQSALDSGGDEKQAATEEAAVKLLAQLQVYQDQEAELLLANISNKTPTTLQQLQTVQIMARCEKWYDNIAACLFGIKRKAAQGGNLAAPTEEELVEALEEKYDAMKDKLLAESLVKQLGDAQWAALSERERQARLVKLKLQEKKLREEGRMDEVARLLGEGLKNDAGLKALMGESRAKQQQRLKERLEKLKQMKQEGKEVDERQLDKLEKLDAEGLESVDQSTLDEIAHEIIAEEGEDATTKSLLHNLQNNFEDEKEALLALLRGADAKLNKEKLRQLELAKLKRQQRKLQNEEKFDTAAILFSMAKEHEAARDASYKQDRLRQEQLARERIAAMKAKREARKATSDTEERKELEEVLMKEQQQDRKVDQLEAMELHEGGAVALQEAILNEIEKKHVSEQEFLAKLLEDVEGDKEATAAACYLSDSQRMEKLDEFCRKRQSWRSDSIRMAMQAVPEQQQTEDEVKANISRIAESRSQQEKILKDALVYKLETMKQELINKGVAEAKLSDEVPVTLFADLQQKQSAENKAMTKILLEKEGTVLFRIKDDQRKARREGWMDNVAATIVGSRPVRKRSTALEAPSDMGSLHEGDEEAAELEEEQERKLQEMEEDLKEQKEAQLKSGASEQEIQAALSKLQQQHEAKRKAVIDASERQRRIMQEKLESKRRKREEALYEEDMAASIVTMAERQFALMREKTMMKKEGQKDTLHERLARRREERRKRAEEEEARRKAEEEKSKKASEEREAELKTKKNEWPLPPGFTMKREKTVVEVDMSEEKQKEIITSLIREHTSVGMKFERERTRQEDLIKRRREKKRIKKEQEETQAAEILGLGERQKTIVMEKQKEERERQISTIRERIARVRYEKTMTMKEPKDKDSPQGFDSLLSEEETRGLSEEEKMKRIAAKMEEKFKKEQRRQSQVAATLSPPAVSPEGGSGEISEDERVERSHTLLDAKGKERKLKERMGRRKKARGSIANQGSFAVDNALTENPSEEHNS